MRVFGAHADPGEVSDSTDIRSYLEQVRIKLRSIKRAFIVQQQRLADSINEMEIILEVNEELIKRADEQSPVETIGYGSRRLRPVKTIPRSGPTTPYKKTGTVTLRAVSSFPPPRRDSDIPLKPEERGIGRMEAGEKKEEATEDKLYTEANLLLESGEIQPAIELFRKIAKTYAPESPSFWTDFMRAYRCAKNYNGVRMTFLAAEDVLKADSSALKELKESFQEEYGNAPSKIKSVTQAEHSFWKFINAVVVDPKDKSILIQALLDSK